MAVEARDFEAFYRELDWARRLAFVLTGDGAATDDLVQEAFACVYKHYAALARATP